MFALGSSLVVVACIVSISCEHDLVFVADSGSSGVDNQNAADAINSVDTQVFIPTEEWQVIEPGQSIPAGLQIRINLQTGLKEARLLEKEPTITLSDSGRTRISPALEEALKSIATSHDEPSGNKEKTPQPDSNARTFRSLEEIRQQFEQANFTISSEMEIITGLFSTIRRTSGSDNNALLHLLEDLEYYLHQFDNAAYFAEMGGMAILTDLLGNDSNSTVKRSAARTIGAACQSNNQVAKKASASGAVTALLHILSQTEDNSLLSSAVYALSAILRADQDSWVHLTSGLNVLRDLVRLRDVSTKLRVKVYTLFADLLDIQKDLTNSRFISSTSERSAAISDICQLATEVLSDSLENIDYTEKMLQFITKSCHIMCSFDKRELDPLLDSLEKSATIQLDDADVMGTYFRVLNAIIDARQCTAQHSHSEL